MGIAITKEQNAKAASTIAAAISKRFSDGGIKAESVSHSNDKKFDFVRITCEPNQWRAVAKWLAHEGGVGHCSMVTGTHFPDGPAERGWEVVVHLMKWPIVNVAAHSMIVHDPSKFKTEEVPMDFEVVIPIAAGDSPSIPTVQDIWVGADWNEKETWDLVGIDFEGHVNMHRVLNPHDSPVGFHPLQRQHKIRYHDFNEMYDDPQGFGRKPVDEGRVK